MRKYLGFIVLTFCVITSSTAQLKEIVSSSSIKAVTVFRDGAQIEQISKVKFPAGKSLIVLSGLSPFVKNESIRVSGNGKFTILNVQFENNYVKELSINAKADSLNQKIA